MNEDDSEDLEIDYMHPHGKPKHRGPRDSDDHSLDDKPSWRNLRRALEEADGHSMKKPDPFLHDDSAHEDSK